MARHLRIEGIVQGVGYRAAFAARARQLQLSGWVRNRLDGSVEAVVTGPTASIQQMLEWARRGPPGAQVSQILVSDIADQDLKSGEVEIRPTG